MVNADIATIELARADRLERMASELIIETMKIRRIYTKPGATRELSNTTPMDTAAGEVRAREWVHKDVLERLDRIESALGKIAHLHSPQSISAEEHARKMAAAIQAGDKKKIKQLQREQWAAAKRT